MKLKGLYYRIRNELQSFWWVLNDKCEYCGGDLWCWSVTKAYCSKCGKKN